MTDKLLQKYIERNGVIDPEVSPAEIEATDDFGCFGWFRGIQDRALMLELRKKTGNIVAIPYCMIEKLEFDPSEGITLRALGQKIHIKGRNLNSDVRQQVSLLNGLCRHRVPWIQEADQTAVLQAGQKATVVDEITL